MAGDGPNDDPAVGSHCTVWPAPGPGLQAAVSQGIHACSLDRHGGAGACNHMGLPVCRTAWTDRDCTLCRHFEPARLDCSNSPQKPGVNLTFKACETLCILKNTVCFGMLAQRVIR